MIEAMSVSWKMKVRERFFDIKVNKIEENRKENSKEKRKRKGVRKIMI